MFGRYIFEKMKSREFSQLLISGKKWTTAKNNIGLRGIVLLKNDIAKRNEQLVFFLLDQVWL